MPQTITKTVFTFNELSDRAKEKARDWFRQRKAEWWAPDEMEFVIDDAERMGAMLGITINRRQWTNTSGYKGSSVDMSYVLDGRYGQSVGFNGTYAYAKGSAKAIRAETNDTDLIAIADKLQAIQRRHFYGLTATIGTAGRDKYSISATVDDAAGYDVAADCNDELEEVLQDFSHWVFKNLEREYEYSFTDECIDEGITSNEYTFDADGRRDD